MKIRVIGAGFYGCHIAVSLLADGHDIVIHEIKDKIFGGASGSIPARIHQGFHYPRSKKTRLACQEHSIDFMSVYGKFTRSVSTNIYAIADNHSMVDYWQYVDTLKDEIEFIEIDPAHYNLQNVEGALLTKERHIVTDDVITYFEDVLASHIYYNKPAGKLDDSEFDLTIDASFCANDSAGIDRYEPCVVGLLSGPTNTAVTIMDGPFASIYPWNEKQNLSSISSAKWTPFSKECKTWEEADYVLKHLTETEISNQLSGMMQDLGNYYPAISQYSIVGPRLSIRAMPLSGADARLVDVVKISDRVVRVRAGKIDAVVQAEKIIKKLYVG